MIIKIEGGYVLCPCCKKHHGEAECCPRRIHICCPDDLELEKAKFIDAVTKIILLEKSYERASEITKSPL